MRDNRLVVGGKIWEVSFPDTPFSQVTSKDDDAVYGMWNIPDVDGKEPIIKFDLTDGVVISKAYDEWDNRKTASYTELSKGQ